MNTHITSTANISSAAVVQAHSPIAKGFISIDLHHDNSVADQALFECYEDLLLSGTATKTRAEFLHAVNTLGGNISVSVRAGVLTIEVASLATVWTKMLILVQEMLTEPACTQSELQRVKTLVINELHDAKEDAKTIAHHNLVTSLYPASDRRCVASIADLQASVSRIKRAEVLKLHQRLQQRRWTVSVVGSAAACTQFSTTVLRLTATNAVKLEQQPQVGTETKRAQPLLLEHIPSRQNIELSIGCALPLKPGDADYPAVVFAIAVLAKMGGFAGRLMSIVREKEGLTYGIYGQLTGYNQTTNGYLRIMTFFSPDQVEQGITSTCREIKKLCATGITAKEFQSFTNILETSRVLQNDSPMTKVAVVHQFNLLGFSVEDIEAYHESFKILTRARVNKAIATYLAPMKLIVSAAGPVQPITKQLQAVVKSM